MQTLKLDGKRWSTEQDFYEALASALGSFDGHGHNADAFAESMIYYLALNAIQPPYDVAIRNAPPELQPFLQWFARIIADARQGRRDDPNWGDDVQVTITFA